MCCRPSGATFTPLRFGKTRDVHEIDLATLVTDFAAPLKAVDARQPCYVSRSGRAYQPGLGPFAEDVAVALITGEMKTAKADFYDTMACQALYPGTKQKMRPR